MTKSEFTWYEFFAGGGMARLGIGPGWDCIFANEISEKKASAYKAYFGPSPELKIGDVAELKVEQLPGTPNLVWASFPCQDLSLAGNGAGLSGKRSGTFRPFWNLVKGMVAGGRAPQVVVLENVTGTLTSHNGSDFKSIVNDLVETGYRVGALVVNASRFLPQSRPRLFILGLYRSGPIPSVLTSNMPSEPFHTESLVRAYNKLPERLRQGWIWWALPTPKDSVSSLASIVDEYSSDTLWHSECETSTLLRLMTAKHRKKVSEALAMGNRMVGTIYKRTRPNRSGVMVQRAEVRFDGVSGCLRTPIGGSSRQTVIIVNNGTIRTRLLSTREAARLMGVPDNYPLPSGYNDAYHLVGDGVAVPVVRWLESKLLKPLVNLARFEQVA
jgi:DNA (cytosine-5)-methyltransferase 1